MDPNLTDVVCEGLNGMELADRNLVVQRASQGRNQPQDIGVANITSAAALLPIMAGVQSQPSTVLLLMNMVSPEELVDDDEYQGKPFIFSWPHRLDMCCVRYYGRCQGRMFPVRSVEESTAAARALAGRKFADRTVVTSFYPEDKFSQGDFD